MTDDISACKFCGTPYDSYCPKCGAYRLPVPLQVRLTDHRPHIQPRGIRCVVLQILAQVDAEISLPMLSATIGKVSPPGPSLERLAMDLRWLAARGLVTLRKVGGMIDAVVISERGRETLALHTPAEAADD